MTKLKKAIADPQPFVVRRSGIQGKGGFALRDIRKGERVAEYVGERISWKEADERYDDDKMGRHHTFLFSVTKRTVIDAAFGGNDSRFINHSCDPNCEAVDEKNRIFIEAIKPIRTGEELFYDYAYDRDKNTTEEDEKLYVCLCGSPKCRGTILAPPKKQAPARRQSAARKVAEKARGKTSATGARRGGSTSGRSKRSAGGGTRTGSKRGGRTTAKRGGRTTARKGAA